MPTKQANGKYKTNLRYPKKYREITGISSEKFQKTFPSKSAAIKAENEMKKKIAQVLREENANSLEIKGDMKFKEFYEKKWLERYKLGQTGHIKRPPTTVTIKNTEDIFRLHILPMFGNYALNHLNANTEIISDELTFKSKEYANIKIVKGYVRSIFDLAEMLGYIEVNRTTKIIQSITSPKKITLAEKRENEGKQALTPQQLSAWIQAIEDDYKNQKLSEQDYTLFMLTMYLGDRKSETYALKWKNIDLESKTILIEKSLDKQQTLKPTKGRKKTVIKISDVIVNLLTNWKNSQQNELKKIKVKQNPEQYLFTYTKPSGEVNCPVHIDYLNYRIKSIESRHADLEHLTPHKLRHTFATLARQGGADITKISEALTHSEVGTTKIYVNTPDIVELDVFQAFEKALQDEEMCSNVCSKAKKETPSAVTESAQKY